MDIRKRMYACVMMVLMITVTPQHCTAEPSLIGGLIYSAITLIVGTIAGGLATGAFIGGGYSAYTYSKKSPKETINAASQFLENISNKYNDLLTLYAKAKANPNNLECVEILRQKILKDKNLKRNLHNDIRKIIRLQKASNRCQKKLISGNKYKFIDEYEELKKISHQLESIETKLKDLQSYVKRSIRSKKLAL